jgi:hypothetical protein
MTPQWAETQPAGEIYGLLRLAAARKQPVAAMYDGLPRLLCPHVLGRNKDGQLRALCYQFGGSSGSGLGRGSGGLGGWRCLAVDKLSHVELQDGYWSTASHASQQSCVEQIDFDTDAQPEREPQNGQ